MQSVNVVITFCSRTGVTEGLALTAAVGAVQARGSIRLRWLPEIADDQTVEAVPEWKESRARMEQEYISPREIDAEWADALIVVVPSRLTISAPELKSYLDSLESVREKCKLHDKVATAFISGIERGAAVLPALHGALAQLGFIVLPPAGAVSAEPREAILLQGRKVTEVARALKEARAIAADSGS